MPGSCVYKDEYEMMIDDDFDENEVASNLVKKHLRYLTTLALCSTFYLPTAIPFRGVGARVRLLVASIEQYG